MRLPVAIAASSLVPKGQEARSFWALNTASRTVALSQVVEHVGFGIRRKQNLVTDKLFFFGYY